MTTRYDDALPKFAAIAKRELGERAAQEHFFLRDSSGQLTLVLIHKVDDEKINVLKLAAKELHPYVESADAAVAYPNELLDIRLSEPEIGDFEYLKHPEYEGFVRVVERRIVGQDWLEEPKNPIDGVPPIVVFASHKGGVGRSTALAILSIALAEKGYDSLVVDLDLEAPGIGDIFLGTENFPKYGTLDYFVETSIEDVDDQFMEDMLAVSNLTRGRGRIHVCPAIGQASSDNPQNVLGKIARAYLEGPKKESSFLFRTRDMIKRLSERNRYDVILVDARAGLNEATAAAVLGLGADVLLFGVDTPQTFSGYHYFLSYLARFRPSDSLDDDWRSGLRMIHAKASADTRKQLEFRNQSFELFADSLYDQEKGVDRTSFNFDYDDKSAPHYAWIILDDSNFSEFKPLQQPEQVSEGLYQRTFGPFVESLIDNIGLGRSDDTEIR